MDYNLIIKLNITPNIPFTDWIQQHIYLKTLLHYYLIQQQLGYCDGEYIDDQTMESFFYLNDLCLDTIQDWLQENNLNYHTKLVWYDEKSDNFRLYNPQLPHLQFIQDQNL